VPVRLAGGIAGELVEHDELFADGVVGYPLAQAALDRLVVELGRAASA
jgi:hypothetical protein